MTTEAAREMKYYHAEEELIYSLVYFLHPFCALGNYSNLKILNKLRELSAVVVQFV